jgi:hypothetical protein
LRNKKIKLKYELDNFFKKHENKKINYYNDKLSEVLKIINTREHEYEQVNNNIFIGIINLDLDSNVSHQIENSDVIGYQHIVNYYECKLIDEILNYLNWYLKIEI